MEDNTKLIRIAVTPPEIHPDEARMITVILESGWDFVHLRHPGASLRDMRNIIENVPQRLHRRLKLHGHFDLVNDFNLGGLHLNKRCPAAPRNYPGPISRSCHSVEEVKRYAGEYCYVTLSPIFPSISKPGYAGSFTPEELSAIPQGKVIALGGVDPGRLSELRQYPFAGYAMLGYLWEAADAAALRQRLDLINRY